MITGHGPTLPNEYVLSLFKCEDDGTAHVVATDSIANGQFRFEIPVLVMYHISTNMKTSEYLAKKPKKLVTLQSNN